jgi:hypothetical protein
MRDPEREALMELTNMNMGFYNEDLVRTRSALNQPQTSIIAVIKSN